MAQPSQNWPASAARAHDRNPAPRSAAKHGKTAIISIKSHQTTGNHRRQRSTCRRQVLTVGNPELMVRRLNPRGEAWPAGAGS
jgi:hypothetical protein